MADFITRRLPQAPQQTSSLISLIDHIQNEANPHPQYLLISDYLSGGAGSIDLSAYLRASVYNTYISENDAWKNSHTTDANPHSQYVLNSTYTTKINAIDGSISDLDSTVGNHTTSISVLETNYSTLNGIVSGHTQTLESHTSTINSHTTSIGNLQSGKLDASVFTTHISDEYSVLSNAFDDHLTDNETNFHPQYVLKSVYDTKIQALEGLISGTDTTGFLTVSDLVGKAVNNPPTNSDTNKPLSGYWGFYLNGLITAHTANIYSQSQNGIIPLHVDNTGAELYARRVHTHTPAEAGAAPAIHNHDSLYLKPSDIFTNRNITAYSWKNGNNTIYTKSNTPIVGETYYSDQNLESVTGTLSAIGANFASVTANSVTYTRGNADNTILNVNALSNIFSLADHSHSEFELLLPELEKRGIYPSAVFKTESIYSTDDPQNPTITEGNDLNTFILQGEYYIKYSGSNLNMPFTDFEGFVKISSTQEQDIEYERDENTDVITVQTPGRTNVVQRARADKTGTEFSRFGYVIETVDAQDNTKLAKTYTYGSWKVTEAESVISSGDSTATYTANRESARTHIVTLNTNCTLTLSNMRVGETLELQVTTSGNKTLTFNNVVILSTADSGKFVCKFSNKTGTPQLDVIFAVLA